MFKIESYVTPILLSYVDKYVRDFKPADAQVSLWGGGVALHNLVLKADVLQKEVALPFTLISGRIHELLIQVPWTKIMSEPIVVTIDTIECVLSLNPPVTPDGPPSESPSRKAQVVETPPGYMQALVRRIVSNIALRVHHLIVKYVQDDIVMSLNVKHLAVDSAGINWEPAFADIDQNHPVIRRLVRLDDLTLCLDKSDDDGKIRFFQEPLLYRCQLDLRVLTRLISANTRRATNLNVQLRSTRLAWSITNDQLVLLLRLVRERPVTKPQSPAPKQSVTQLPPHTISSNSAEPARSESWSEWAWSWLPTWMDREGGVEEAPVPATPLPVFFTAFLDEVSIVFKVMEMENMNRKRSRSILEVNAVFAALKSTICTPTSLRVRFGARDVLVRSQGKCVCGHVNFNSANDEPTDFLKKIGTEGIDRQWSWPEEDLNEKVETAEVVDETFRASPTQSTIPEGNPEQSEEPSKTASKETQEQQDKRELEETDDLWAKMSPLLYVEYNHERSPPTQFTNPYESPPKDFEYSDWVEECNMSIQLEPVEIRVCMGLVHRLNALRMIYLDRPPPQTEQQMRILTIEENEALTENLPQKRISIEARGLCIRIIPWNHVPADRCSPAPLVLELRIPKTSAAITAPLYPHRVCSAACQMPQDKGPLYLGARRHITVTVSSLQAYVCNPGEAESRPCARADIRLVTHQLLNKAYFAKQESIEFAYHLKIKEFSICGSSARLQAAFQVPLSLFQKRRSLLLKHTTIAKDALNDEEAVAVDIVMEDLILRGYITNNVRTHVATLQSAKATAFHAPKGGELKQAWLFSAPAAPASTTYFRMAIQWCKEQLDDSVDYMCMWAQPLAISVDPLLIAFLAYKPTMRPDASMNAIKTLSSTQSFMRRRATPPSSSGRGLSRTGSGQGAELVHVRSRSHGSGSEPSEKKDTKFPIIPVQPKSPDTWWSGENLVALYKRLRSMLINIEVGLVLVYVTMSTASAIDCATIRDAMERHASEMHRVLAISLGRLSVTSSSATKSLWAELRHDGPTYVSKKLEAESFPWKLCLADVSCYTLEVRPVSGDVTGLDRAGASAGLKSRLKVPPVAMPRTVLELVTTSITISVETKSIQYKNVSRKQVSKSAEIIQEDQRTKYFTSGTEFKPTTLKEFVRGPSERQKRDSNEVKTSTTNEMPSPNEAPPEVVTVIPGPVVSLGVHLHADTPPIIIRLERDQL